MDRKQITIGIHDGRQAIRVGPLGEGMRHLLRVEESADRLVYTFTGDVYLTLQREAEGILRYTLTMPDFSQSGIVSVKYKTLAFRGSEAFDKIQRLQETELQ